MRPAAKYAIVALLHRAGSAGVWEYDLYTQLRPRYEDGGLHGIREDLISLSTVGWVTHVDEREHAGALLRRYTLGEHIRAFVEYQLDLSALFAWLDAADERVPAGPRRGQVPA
jgi:hypothetical protein